jgi:hypothetical protein
MIPPCDPSILESNPQFKRIYENLLANLLNPDGSTRAHGADPTREAVAEVRRGAFQNPRHNKDHAETPISNPYTTIGSATLSDTEREEADKGADAQAAGVCYRQQSLGRGAEPLQQNDCPSNDSDPYGLVPRELSRHIPLP